MGSAPLSVAQVSPYAVPGHGDIAEHVARVAGALAARGHRVTLLAPSGDRAAVARGQELLRRAGAGDLEVLRAEPGQVLPVAVGRSVRAGRGRRVGGPFDLATALERALAGPGFDVAHLHEPLAPSPALAALGRASGVRVASFHQPDTLAGVAFLGPLVERALDRVDLRIAPGESVRRAFEEVLPGRYAVIIPGVGPSPSPEAATVDARPPLVILARGRQRVGVRFAASIVRSLDLELVGEIRLIGPPDTPWRTRAALGKALRSRVRVMPDEGAEMRAAALADGVVAVIATPEDALGPPLREAMAAGAAVLAPRCPAVAELVTHADDARVLTPFDRRLWAAAVAELAADPDARRRLGAAARARASARSWDAMAADLELAYRAAADAPRRRSGRPSRVRADLRVRPPRGADPVELVAACRGRDLDVVAVASPAGIGPALAVADAAGSGLAVIVGAEIRTRDGVVVGLFLSRDIPGGLPLADTLDAIHDQEGVALIPHPQRSAAPDPAVLRAVAGRIDCFEALCGTAGEPSEARALQATGLLATAGSGAEHPGDVGGAVTELRPFESAADLLAALPDAELERPGQPARRSRTRARGDA